MMEMYGLGIEYALERYVLRTHLRDENRAFLHRNFQTSRTDLSANIASYERWLSVGGSGLASSGAPAFASSSYMGAGQSTSATGQQVLGDWTKLRERVPSLARVVFAGDLNLQNPHSQENANVDENTELKKRRDLRCVWRHFLNSGSGDASVSAGSDGSLSVS